ncbi:MAG TPA: FKBP-type peptidyl-prolyl cis-trans isomerase [Allosphingosinicella sp.]|nr:FKBP-type peptidyl-prolyl cis-trans isomerase [Allosphingosinicella sp.]
MLKLWLALIVLIAAVIGIAWLGTAPLQRIKTESGLQYQVLKAGEGPRMTAADVLVANYTGRTESGTEFDSTTSRGQPWVTTVNNIIPGMKEALQLMQAGGRYRVWIPPHLGYGPGRVPRGAPFGENDTLVFEIEVLQIAPGMAQMYEMQQMQQMQQQMQQSQGGAPGAPGEGTGASAGGRPGR